MLGIFLDISSWFFQLCSLFIHLMSPHQDLKLKLFALQLTKLKRGDSLLLNIVLGGVTTKVWNFSWVVF
jgi:hypothetical protein